MLRPFAHPVACCWMLLHVVAQSLKPVKLFSQQLPTFLLFRDRRSVAQQYWICLHSSSNIVGATHAHYAWFTKTYGLYPSHVALQVPALLGVVASVCTPLPARAQQLPTLLAQQRWELLRPCARSLRKSRTVVDSGLHAVDSGFQVLDSSICQWNLDSGFQSLMGFRIPQAVFQILKPSISTGKMFLNSEIQIPLLGAT